MKKSTVIYFDASCEICNDFVAHHHDHIDDVTTVDVSQPYEEGRISAYDSWKYMHVITPDGHILKGVDAVVYLLQGRWYYPLLQRLLKISVLHRLAERSYAVVSRFRHAFSSVDQRLDWVVRFISFGLLLAILVGPQIWFSNVRTFPPLPVFSSLALLSQLDSFLTILLSIGLVGVALFPRTRQLLAAVVVAIMLLLILDYSRWQPWLYQYLVFLLVITISRKPLLAFSTLQILQALVYLWAGIQKLNATFLTQVFPWMMEPVTGLLGIVPHSLPLWVGFCIPIIEIVIGVGLLFRNTRQVAFLLAIATHISVLLLIGPFGQNWNAVVWPWNIAMIGITFGLFLLSPHEISKNLPRLVFSRYTAFIILFAVMPIFAFINRWDSYLSFALYSGNTSQIHITMQPEVVNETSSFPEMVQFTSILDGEAVVNVDAWAMRTFHASLYPEPRVYDLVFKAICMDVHHPELLTLRIWNRPAPLTGKRTLMLTTCETKWAV